MNKEEKRVYDELCALAKNLCDSLFFGYFAGDEVDMEQARECLRDAYCYLRVGEEDDED